MAQDSANARLSRRASSFAPEPLKRILSRLQRSDGLKYRELLPDEIRVLHLEPGKFGTRLRCRLKHIKLAVPVSLNTDGYEALSYAWGLVLSDHQLRIKQVGKSPMTESLYQALQHFRYEKQPRRLWADAICIDQRNDTEKEHQVRLMGQVFRRASKVLVWLGPADPAQGPHDIAAFAAMTNLDVEATHRSHPEADDASYLSRLLSDARKCRCCNMRLKPQNETPTWPLQAIAQLINRSWFSRMWIIQEVLLASRVEICAGFHRAKWSSFLLLLSALHSHLLAEEQSAKVWTTDQIDLSLKISDLAHVFLPSSKTRFSRGRFGVDKVLDIMCALSSFGCSNPRDRVFAVRPVLQIEHFERLRPQYCLPASEVYRRLVCQCMEQVRQYCRRYEFLALVGTETTPAHGPSWVPNFHEMTDRSRRKHRIYTKPEFMHSYTVEEDQFAFVTALDDKDDTQLRVKGRVFGTIRAIHPGCSWPDIQSHRNRSSHDNARIVLDWYWRCRAVSGPCATTPWDLCTFLTRGFSSSSKKGNPDLESNATRQDLDIVLLNDVIPSISSNAPEVDQQDCSETLALLLHEVVFSKRRWSRSGLQLLIEPEDQFCIVGMEDEAQIMAWVPPSAVEGDVLCLFHGAPYPFVLREDHDRGGYRLLGDAYVLPLPIKAASGPVCSDDRNGIAEATLSAWNLRRYQDPTQLASMRTWMEEMAWITLV